MNSANVFAAASLCFVVAACSGPASSPIDGAPGDAQTASDASDSNTPAHDATDVATDGAPPTDAGAVTVRCGAAPYLIVTQPSSGAGPSTTVVRAALTFTGAASGITVTRVSQRSAGPSPTELRAWDVSMLAPPTGFTGSVTPMPGWTTADVLFSCRAASLPLEVASCAQAPWLRVGILHVEGTSHETGAFALDCDLSPPYRDAGAGHLGVTCARGVPGWLTVEGSDGVESVSTPVLATLAAAHIHVHALDAAIDGFVANDAVVTNHARMGPPGVTCPGDLPPWDLGSAMHQLWSGGSSMNTWSGPASPGDEPVANWFWQREGMTAPAGYCPPPSMGDPLHSCPSPINWFTLRGQSSAGAWQWESDLFVCYDLSGH